MDLDAGCRRMFSASSEYPLGIALLLTLTINIKLNLSGLRAAAPFPLSSQRHKIDST
jgi:hypothetical protein